MAKSGKRPKSGPRKVGRFFWLRSDVRATRLTVSEKKRRYGRRGPARTKSTRYRSGR